MNSVIEVRDLTKSFHQTRPKKTIAALSGITFSVAKGEIFGILGPNGAGKTTTLEIIEGLKRQTSGSAKVLGFDNIKQVDEIKKRIGVQLQSSQYLHHLSLNELLKLFASLYQSRPWPDQALSENSALGLDNQEKLLDLVGLADKAGSEFKNLSGGQKQRFTIASALVHRPEILFLDEPTTGLDPKARRDLWQLIKTINTAGISVVLTTHYMEEAEYLCHRVAILDQGKILEIDQPKKLIDRLSSTIQVSFFTDREIDAEFFAGELEIDFVHAERPQVILELSDLDKVAPLIALLKKRGVVHYGFTLKTASLEDAYLKLTGREFPDGN